VRPYAIWHLRHAKADTTANEYMQEEPESEQEMVGSVYLMPAQGAEENHGSGICSKTQQSPRVVATLGC
jgi:hypothetical protein